MKHLPNTPTGIHHREANSQSPPLSSLHRHCHAHRAQRPTLRRLTVLGHRHPRFIGFLQLLGEVYVDPSPKQGEDGIDDPHAPSPMFEEGGGTFISSM
jgi:hypothetical protein